MGTAITWLGHSTALIESGGVRLLTDPLLRRRVAHLRRRDEVADPGPVDAVLLSHVHMDHLDQPSLRAVGTQTRVIVPRGAGRLLTRRGFGDVAEVDAGDEHAVGELIVRAIPAEHPAKRIPGTAEVPTLGFSIGEEPPILFWGDTDRFESMATFGGARAVLLPIAGWGPKLPAGHLNPQTAAEALALLRPEVVIPIHWGTYAPVHRGPAPEDPVREFVRRVGEVAPEVEVRVLGRGERTEL